MKCSILCWFSLIIFLFTSACFRENETVGTTVDGYVINQENSNKVSDANVFLLHGNGPSGKNTTLVLETQSDSNGYYFLHFEGFPHNFYWVKAEKDGYNPSIMILIDAGSSSYGALFLNP